MIVGHFAQVDDNDIVVNIIICEKSVIESGRFGDPKYWIETDPYTRHNIHHNEDNQPDGGTPLRGNYATIGEKYDRENDVFYPYRTRHASWKCTGPDWSWKAPIPKPNDGKDYRWSDETMCWSEKV